MTKIFKLLLLSCMITHAAFAQDCASVYLGTKTLYTAPQIKGTPPPVGYSAVFINHIGRHGARHLTKEVQKTTACMLLLKADSANALTETGKQLKLMVLSLDKVETDHIESISTEGKEELKEIGQRMQTNNHSLFSKSLQINVGVTNKKRTKQSAEAFLTGFKVKSDINQYLDDTDLRFYDLSPAYDTFVAEGAWIPLFNSTKKEERFDQLSAALAGKIFTAAFIQQLSAKQLEKIANEIYGFSTIINSLKTEIEEAGFKTADLNFKSLFSCDELERLGKIDDAGDFFKKGPGMDINGIQVRIAVPLLVNFLKTTDEFIATGRYDLQLRFAHAETVSPFAALLGISTADKATTDIKLINKHWKAAAVVPLSSNVQWILYKKPGANNYLVKVLLNEKEAQITGLKTSTFPYYNYQELKELYVSKLASWGVNLNDHMDQYLKTVK